MNVVYLDMFLISLLMLLLVVCVCVCVCVRKGYVCFVEL